MTYYLKISNKQANTIQYAIRFLLHTVPVHMKKSITYDNGSENILHQQVNVHLGTCSYFCTPYHSWEKGQVEYAIRLFRRYFPKKTNFNRIKSNDIIRVQHSINNLARKCLGFLSPSDAWRVALNR